MLETSISFVFFISFIVYLFLGAYAIAINKKGRLNHVFLFLCLDFSIWAFTFALSNSARTYEEALLWRRISSLGWGIIYSIFLHFTLLLTEAHQLLRKKWIYLALYLPAAVNVYFFGYSKLAGEKYHLVHTPAGWGTLPLNNFWDGYFNVYYLLFALISVLLLIRWLFTTTEARKKKHAMYLLISLVISLFVGTFTDRVVNHLFAVKLPSLAPIIIMIPTVMILRIIHKYGLMLPKKRQELSQETSILNSNNRVSLFRYFAMSLCFGSIANLLVYMLYVENWTSGIALSTGLAIVGVSVFVLPYVVQSVKIQERVLLFFLVISMPLIMFFYYDPLVSNIVWPIPLFFIMVTVVFNNKKMFLTIAVISLMAGVYSWYHVAELTIQVGPMVHLFRVGFYGIGITLTVYIHKIYITRLQENEKQVAFQQMISKISTNFVTIASANFNEKMADLLQQSAQYIKADRSYLGLFAKDQNLIHFTNEWIRTGIENVKGMPVKSFAWYINQLQKNEIVFVPSVEELPPEAKMEKRLMQSQKVQSFLSIPITNKETVIGFLGFDQIGVQKGWHKEDHDLLKVLANIVADGIAKIEVEKEINHLAYYDSLTGLPNRTLFSNRLEQAIHLAKRSETYIGVIFLDLDEFKAVNDTLGHDWGDNLLQQIGNRLTACVRKYDTVTRFGGDEYLIMIPQISRLNDLEEVAKKITGIFSKPVLVKEQEFFVTASVGIAVFPADGEEGSTLIKNADMAMYHAKKNGKNQYAFCSGSMKEEVVKKLTLTNSLYRALERNEFILHYQPQVCIKSQKIIGFEALIRWNHPELGRIPPNVFIPIAEQTGLINSIGEWVLTTACKQNKEWQDRGYNPVAMAVNLSIEQFRSRTLLHTVKECLEKTGLDARYLELEITEGIAMKESKHIIQTLNELKALGITITIDDFGTEYSSLSRLKDLPVDRLKMDLQFVQGISVNSKDESIITVILHLAKSLGLNVIAEGVETEIQLEFLVKQKCDQVQGYYYYKPMSAEEIEEKAILLSIGQGGE